MDMERVSQPLEGWFGFIRAGFVALFKKLFRVNLYAMAAMVLAVLAILAGAAAVYFVGGMPGWALLAISILAAIILVVVSRLFGLALYKVVDEEHGAKQKVDIIGVAKQKAVPAIIYGIIMLVIYAIVLIPFGLVGLGLTAVTAVNVLSPFLQLGAWLVSIPLGFFLQFTLFELVLADKGAVESIRGSFGLVKRNFWETVVFSIVRAATGWVVSVPFVFVLVVAIFGAVIIGVAGGIAGAMAGGAWPLLGTGGIALMVLFLIPFSLVCNSTDEAVLLSMSYRYWKTIRGDIKLEKKAAKPAAAPSEARAIMATPESPVMVAPAAGAMAMVPEAKKAQTKKPAPKRAANKKSS
ncbi:MAG: hypothetical protein PHV13_04540 [Candidatus ainarchaeum sp.]|nr:hypothetical protein [Candidatus ainarchaeum sp.]